MICQNCNSNEQIQKLRIDEKGPYWYVKCQNCYDSWEEEIIKPDPLWFTILDRAIVALFIFIAVLMIKKWLW